jgi:hypothetical protein
MADGMTSSRGANSDTVNTSINVDTGAMQDGTIPMGGLAQAGADTAWFLNQWKNTHEYNLVNKYSDLNYDAGKADSGLYINTGAGNDTVTNWGSGAWDVRLGTGNDTYYSDNTGNRAVWVFNTRNQAVRNDANLDRLITNNGLLGNDGNTFASGLRSDENTSYTGFKGHLTVTLTLPNYDGAANGLLAAALRPTYTSTVSVALGNANGVVTDLEINQAIKTAINTDPVLGKLLEAVDGSGDTLVVRSLIDGRSLDSFDTNAVNLGGGGNAFEGLKVNFIADAGYSNTAITEKGDYLSALATQLTVAATFNNDGSLNTAAQYAPLTGNPSGHTTANRVHIESGNDVVVLSTGAQSQDVLVFDSAVASNSKTTVVHFDTNRNQVGQGGQTFYEQGQAETFTLTFSALQLALANTPATLAILGGAAITIEGLTNGAGIPSTTAIGVVDAIFEQIGASAALNDFTSGVGFGRSSNLGSSYYWYATDRDNDGTVDTYWRLTKTANGTGIIFTEISPTNSSAQVGTNPFNNVTTAANLAYVHDNAIFFDPTDATKIVDRPVASPLSGAGVPAAPHFVWQGLAASVTANPIAVAGVDGEQDGHAASAAQIAVNYANSSVAYSGTFFFAPNADGTGGIPIRFTQGQNETEVIQAIKDAVNRPGTGWTATSSGTVVTYTRDTTGPLDDPDTFANEWTTYFQTANNPHLGDFGVAPGQDGIATLTIESGLIAGNGGNFTFLGLPVTVTDTAGVAITADAVAGAIAAAFAVAKATMTPAAFAAAYPALANWDTVQNLAGAVLTFTQLNPDITPVTTLLPDDALKLDSTVRAVELGLSDHDFTNGNNTAHSMISFAIHEPTGGQGHPGGVISIETNAVAHTSVEVAIPSGSNAAAIAALIAAAAATYTDVNTVAWNVTAVGSSIHFETGGNSNVAPTSILSAVGSTGGTFITASAETPATQAVLDDMLDTGAPVWTTAPILGQNGINAVIVVGNNTHDGADAWKAPTGTQNPGREAYGDGDYLDFSAFDAYKVVVGTSTVAQTTDTAGTGKYVVITGGVDGVYDFTLHTDGSTATQLIGIIDFGETMNFDASNFILFNDIIV